MSQDAHLQRVRPAKCAKRNEKRKGDTASQPSSGASLATSGSAPSTPERPPLFVTSDGGTLASDEDKRVVRPALVAIKVEKG